MELVKSFGKNYGVLKEVALMVAYKHTVLSCMYALCSLERKVKKPIEIFYENEGNYLKLRIVKILTSDTMKMVVRYPLYRKGKLYKFILNCRYTIIYVQNTKNI
ncbi:MAG: hypothetical protein JJT76_01180 [Clostridiaceae bacterium]|nr:hypothetical protein [Clostridiaceae bacterium]